MSMPGPSWAPAVQARRRLTWMDRRLLGALILLLLLITGTAAYNLVPRIDEGGGEDTASVIVIAPNSTVKVTVRADGDGMRIEDILGNVKGWEDNGTTYCYTDDGGLFRARMGSFAHFDDGAFSLEGGETILGFAWGGGTDIQTLMSVSTTAALALNLSHGSTAPALVRTDADRVVVLELDGLGREILKKNDVMAPNIISLGNITPALSAYPPITNVGTSMAVTGYPSSENGILQRADHSLRKPTFLELASRHGLEEVWLEGDTQFLDADMETHVDINGNGSADDEIHFSLLRELNGSADVIMAHYHLLDDTGHRFGINSGEYEGALSILDSRVGEVMQELRSSDRSTLLVLFSDHGMHDDADGLGVHGSMDHRDMFAMTAYGLFGGAEESPEPGIVIGGSTENEVEYTLDEFRSLPSLVGNYTLKSSGGPQTNRYTGVPLHELLQEARPVGGTSIKACSVDGMSIQYPIDYSYEGSGVIVAYAMNGKDLTDDGPLRVIVPQSLAGEYNSQVCLKRVVRIEVVS